MEQFMPFFYAALWFAVGLILMFSMSKENKIFIFAGAFFLVLGCWWVADALLPAVDLFSGGWGIALKCLTGGAFVKEYRKKSAEAASKDKEE